MKSPNEHPYQTIAEACDPETGIPRIGIGVDVRIIKSSCRRFGPFVTARVKWGHTMHRVVACRSFAIWF